MLAAASSRFNSAGFPNIRHLTSRPSASALRASAQAHREGYQAARSRARAFVRAPELVGLLALSSWSSVWVRGSSRVGWRWAWAHAGLAAGTSLAGWPLHEMETGIAVNPAVHLRRTKRSIRVRCQSHHRHMRRLSILCPKYLLTSQA